MEKKNKMPWTSQYNLPDKVKRTVNDGIMNVFHDLDPVKADRDRLLASLEAPLFRYTSKLLDNNPSAVRDKKLVVLYLSQNNIPEQKINTMLESIENSVASHLFSQRGIGV